MSRFPQLKLEAKIEVTERGKRAPKYEVDSSGEVTLEDFMMYLKTALVTIAGDTLKEEQDQGFDKKPVIVVDGRRNKPAEQVLPWGKIEIFARADMGKMLLKLYQDLLKRSPTGSGLYINHHWVFVNSRIVARSEIEWKKYLNENTFEDRDVIRFVNYMPYSGWLERQSISNKGTGGPKMVASKDQRGRAANKKGMVRRPNGVYFLTARSYKSRFSKNVFVNFGFMPGSQLGFMQPFPAPTQRTPLRRTFGSSFGKGKGKFKGLYKGPYVYPFVAVRIRAEGIL